MENAMITTDCTTCHVASCKQYMKNSEFITPPFTTRHVASTRVKVVQ